ncbi:Large ribosomal subunit protein uL29m [Cladobotryum mycophilum]|uniref:Large ribosomal subunit protein uL29m n=1 Tax=Cladobotryum mycophilum TaxID=491253 RepID=A0ABR0T218_9HYPO
MSMAGSNALRASQGCVSRLSAPLSKISTFSPATTNRVAAFSTTAPQCKRKTKDSNKRRGVSSLYGSGPREPLSMSNIPLPKPRDFKPKVQVGENHGLWGFFPAKGQLLLAPKEVEEYGRAWTVEELRKKSWEDLHALWWTCCKERNMLATTKAELERGRYGFGDREIDTRDEEVTKTMRAIKHALTERYYTWQDAFDVARSDPEINLEGGDGQVYTPSAYEEGYDEAGDSWAEPEKGANVSAGDAAATEGQAAKLLENQPAR